jgi:7-cyano-7-deazaguanine synthase
MIDAIVLLSGGLDSATTLAVARDEGRRCGALSFLYGQRCRVEVEAARRVASAMGVEDHRVMELDRRQFAGSALTGDAAVPQDRPADIGGGEIPATYVPARNILFLAHGLAWAEAAGAGEVFIGANAVDYSGYPDCRPEFIAAYQRMIDVGTRGGVEGRGVRVRAPLMHLPKAEILRRGLELGVDYSLTMSCYDPDEQGRSCGRCESCRLRLAAFAELGVKDPIAYV